MFGLYYWSLPMLGRVAGIYRRRVLKRTLVVAVTGSFGKTSTARAIKCVLGLPIDPFVGISQPSFKAREVLRMRPRDRYGVVETSIEAPGEMAFAASFIRPDIAVVTSIGNEHLRAFGSLQHIANEKAELLRRLPSTGVAVLNGDDPNVLWMKEVTKAQVVTFGFDASNDVFADDTTMDWPHGMRFRLHAKGETRPMRIRFVGRHTVYAALAAIAVASAAGLALDPIAAALAELEPTPGRLQPVSLPNGAVVLRDEFKSPLETIETSLQVLSEVPASRRIVVLGQISEAPGSHRELQRRIGQLLARSASYAIFFGKSSRSYISGAARAGLDRTAILDARTDVALVIRTLNSILRDGDVVLIKGRASEKLERIALALTGQNMRCTIGFCDAELRCANCKMLGKGWDAYPSHVAAHTFASQPIREPPAIRAIEVPDKVPRVPGTRNQLD